MGKGGGLVEASSIGGATCVALHPSRRLCIVKNIPSLLPLYQKNERRYTSFDEITANSNHVSATCIGTSALLHESIVLSSIRVHPGHISRHINTPQGLYIRVPMQEEIAPAFPERNMQEFSVSPKNNLGTQKLHEILSTPRKARSKSEERTLSPKKQQSLNQTSTPQRRALTPGGSPNGRTFSPTRTTPQGTPQRAFSPTGPQTSTPNKESSALRCLPLLENSSRQQDLCPASNCGRLRYVGTAPVDLINMNHEPSPCYAYTESTIESMPMMSDLPKYQVVPVERKNYQSVESAFMARTVVVPQLSPRNSDANTTMASGMEMSDRKSAPILLILVGLLTSGLALYLSWSQGRRYYFDSAVLCGACCALAGACRSLQRTCTGLGLAGLSALSCAGLLLLAAKSPKDGASLHDVTAGPLCGVSILGAVDFSEAKMQSRTS